MSKLDADQAGFTILEVVVVIIAAVILIAIALFMYK
jgi:prepilin-type N-terminal cleavage/methylation domain-containing protein